MKKILFGAVILLALVATIYFVVDYGHRTKTSGSVPNAKTADTVAEIKITGTVTDVKNDCWVDGVCSIQVDNKWWIPINGGMVEPGSEPKIKGEVKGIQFDERKSSLGKKVEIFGQIFATDTISLYGNADYYVHTIE